MDWTGEAAVGVGGAGATAGVTAGAIDVAIGEELTGVSATGGSAGAGAGAWATFGADVETEGSSVVMTEELPEGEVVVGLFVG